MAESPLLVCGPDVFYDASRYIYFARYRDRAGLEYQGSLDRIHRHHRVLSGHFNLSFRFGRAPEF